MDAGTYQMSRVTDPADSQYAPFTAENAAYYIPRQPAGVYPRWFAARITYATFDQAYFQARLPAGSAVTDRHDTSGLVFALKTADGGALVFYHLTASPPPQTIKLDIPGYHSPSQALTSATVDYADQFAVDIPAGSASPAVVADASGITGQG